jgi:hypothetical protein
MYFIKVNVAIALFYLFYRLFFAGDTFWKTRRYYLLFSVILSFVYPFFSIENWLQNQEPIQKLLVNYATLPEITVIQNQQSSMFTIENMMLATYAMVVLFLLIRLLIQLSSILIIRDKGRFKTVQGTRIISVEKEITPFSFFGSIYICTELHNEMEMKQILTHELTHVRQGHSYDVLLSEMICIIFWFNPATWLLKREIRQNLEFLADNKVIESGFDSKTYQYHLLQLSYQTPEIKLANKFNVSPLKKRIIMMNQKKSAKASLLKYSLIVPLALALVLSSNAQTVVNKAKKALATKEVVTEQKTVKAFPKKMVETKQLTEPIIVNNEKADEKPYEVVEKMPHYQGGDGELLSYIVKNLKYPVIAQESGTQGKLLVRFVVNKDGKVTNASILKKMLDKPADKKGVVVVGYNKQDSIATMNENAGIALEKEALRVVNAMNNWTPGEQDGKKVAVYYILPITFKLQ